MIWEDKARLPTARRDKADGQLSTERPLWLRLGWSSRGFFGPDIARSSTDSTTSPATRRVAALGPVTADDGIVWVAFLVRKASNPNGRDGFAVVSLGNDVTGPSIGIGMLFNKDRYGLDNNTGGKGARARTAVRPNHKTVWLVTKLDFNNAQDTLGQS